MSRSQRRGSPPAVLGKWAALPIVAGLILSAAHWCMARPIQPAQIQERPRPVPPSHLDRTLKTIPIPHDRRPSASRWSIPRCCPATSRGSGSWTSVQAVRIRTVDIPGKGAARSTTSITRW